MNDDLVRRGHCVSRIWGHFSLKIKYAHKIFEKHPEFRGACECLMLEIFNEMGIEVDTYGFDDNHFHAIIDLGFWSLPDVCKRVKGTTGRKLLEMFPYIKKSYFWGSGLWSRTKYFYSIGRDRTSVQRYVGKQKYFKKGLFKRTLPASQSTLSNFAA